MSDDLTLTITLSSEERQTLINLLSDAIDDFPATKQTPTSRQAFNALVQLRMRLNGSIEDVDTNAAA